MPSGPAGGEHHEIGPLALVPDGDDADVVRLDVGENLLNLVQLQQPSVGDGDGDVVVVIDEGGAQGAVEPWKP